MEFANRAHRRQFRIKDQPAVTNHQDIDTFFLCQRRATAKRISWEIDGGLEPRNVDALLEPINSRAVGKTDLTDLRQLPVHSDKTFGGDLQHLLPTFATCERLLCLLRDTSDQLV